MLVHSSVIASFNGEVFDYTKVRFFIDQNGTTESGVEDEFLSKLRLIQINLSFQSCPLRLRNSP